MAKQLSYNEEARRFIQNGIDFGYITKPDPGDSANKTLPKIIAALALANGETT